MGLPIAKNGAPIIKFARNSCYPRCHNCGSKNSAFSDLLEITQFFIPKKTPIYLFSTWGIYFIPFDQSRYINSHSLCVINDQKSPKMPSNSHKI